MNRFALSGALGALIVVCASAGLYAAPPDRVFSSGRFGLELDGTAVGFVSLVQGGNALGSVVKEPAGEDPFIKKHLGNVGYRDIVIEFGGSMPPAVSDWIQLALQRQYAPKNGAIVAVDFNNRVRSRLEFTGAQITEVTFPSADADSREAAHFIVRLTPLFTTVNRAPSPASFSAPLSKTTALRESAFSFTIDGINDLQYVSKVEQITVKLPLLVDPSLVCLTCDPVPVPPIDFPTVSFTTAAAHAGSVDQWLTDFVLNGNNADSAERNGALIFLSNGSPSFALSFSHLGIFEISSDAESAYDAIRRVTVSMYCEQMSFQRFGSKL
jgi:hypothetical protein